MFNQIKCIIPPLLPQFHKGQLGRVLVVGGCEDYTGAPFFASMSALKTGCDMSHVVCTREAATAIKSYSPDIMVHPYLQDEEQSTVINAKIHGLLKRVDVVLVGPGLGRSDNVLDQASQIIRFAHELSLPLVIDADGLFLVQEKPDLVRNYTNGNVVLTPNVMEYHRLLQTAGFKTTFENSQKINPLELSDAFNGAYILRKGESDDIAGGGLSDSESTDGGPRRVSGQGDILSGAIATFIAWGECYKNKLWDGETLSGKYEAHVPIVSLMGAGALVKTASKLAFNNRGRSLVTTDVLEYIGEAFKKLYES